MLKKNIFQVREEHMVRGIINDKKRQGNLMAFDVMIALTEISFAYLNISSISCMHDKKKEKSKYELSIKLIFY